MRTRVRPRANIRGGTKTYKPPATAAAIKRQSTRERCASMGRTCERRGRDNPCVASLAHDSAQTRLPRGSQSPKTPGKTALGAYKKVRKYLSQGVDGANLLCTIVSNCEKPKAEPTDGGTPARED